MLVGVRTNARMGFERALLLVSCSRFIFGEGIRGSDFQSRTLARRSIEFSVKQLSCDLKRQAESMGFEPTWPLRPHDLANRPDKPYSTTFRFHKHAPRDSNPDQLVWNQLCCRYTKGVEFLVFGFRCVVCSV